MKPSIHTRILPIFHFGHIGMWFLLLLLSILLYPSYGKGIGYSLTVLLPFLYIGVGLAAIFFPQLWLFLLDSIVLYKIGASLNGFLILHLFILNLCSLWIAYTGKKYRNQKRSHP